MVAFHLVVQSVQCDQDLYRVVRTCTFIYSHASIYSHALNCLLNIGKQLEYQVIHSEPCCSSIVEPCSWCWQMHLHLYIHACLFHGKFSKK